MKWIFFSTTFFLRLHPFSLTTIKRTSQRRRTEGRNEANAKVRKAEEFPGVSPRVHFARNCATFLQNKAGKVIRRPSKTSVLFSPTVRTYDEFAMGKKEERSTRYEKRAFRLRDLLFIRTVIQNVISSHPFRKLTLLAYLWLSVCTFNAHVATFTT